jgi:YD repeat-containing protein
MAAAKTAKGKTAKPKAAPAPEAVDEDLELDEVSEEEVEETTGKKSSQQEVTFGASDLAKLLSEKAGKPVSTRELRTLIRKMARDGSGRVTREITPGNRTRYNWSGPEDPEVKGIIAAFEGGELEADKKAKLEELKQRKAEKKAAGEPVGKKAKAKAAKGKGKKAAPAPVEVEDDDELELDDDE